MDIITSKDNEKVKYIKSLCKKKYRDLEQKYLIEGVRFMEEAMGYPEFIDSVVYTDALTENDRNQSLLNRISEMGLQVLMVNETVFKELSQTETPQGIMAVMKNNAARAFVEKANPLYLVIDGIQDPGNLGTIIRTADAAGIDGVFLIKGTVDLYNSKTLRSTMGSVFRVPVRQSGEPEEVVKYFKERGIGLYVASANSGKTIYDFDFNVPVAIVMGSEAAGPGSTLTSAADGLLSIPMPGNAESLNVAIATGVILFEAVRQKL